MSLKYAKCDQSYYRINLLKAPATINTSYFFSYQQRPWSESVDKQVAKAKSWPEHADMQIAKATVLIKTRGYASC